MNPNLNNACDIYGNSVGDILAVAALLRQIDNNKVDFIDAFTQPKPDYIYRRHAWSVTVVDTDAPLLLIPANLYRTNFIITAQSPPTNALTEFSYGFPVPFLDDLGLEHWGITIGPAGGTLPSIGFNNATQAIGGTISIDDIYVTIPGLGLGRHRTLPFPTVIEAFEETAQPV